jgi:hypothetical protein
MSNKIVTSVSALYDDAKIDSNTAIIDTDKYTVKESINQIMEILWDRNGER